MGCQHGICRANWLLQQLREREARALMIDTFQLWFWLSPAINPDHPEGKITFQSLFISQLSTLFILCEISSKYKYNKIESYDLIAREQFEPIWTT